MEFLFPLRLAGVFSVALGTLHFFFPVMLDFRQAIPKEGSPLKPFHLLFYRYETKRSDVHGIAWVMNHCVSYVILSIGVLDLFARGWVGTDVGRVIAFWIAGWWFLRAGCQFYLGRRRGDWLVLAWFSALGFLHVIAAFQ